ncbi:hypothetical protein BaRGS_00036348 [Batillaria attramentaria]|uniref:Large ribosomal subunit protein mL49 n=1 Tax=Batillaria attramentaria TaxID=370345 RepID=A0ABD0JBM2_9CAEN
MATVRLLGCVCRVCQVPFGRTVKATHFSSTLVQAQRHHLSSSSSTTVSELTDADLAEYETSTEEFKYVERLLPPKTIPSPPKHESYPTPSGWIPPKESGRTHPYFVRRTKNHVLPIYPEFRNGGTRKLVLIKNIEGDIWASIRLFSALDADLRAHLEQVTGWTPIASQVHEVGRYIRVKGLVADHVCDFLLSKGF